MRRTSLSSRYLQAEEDDDDYAVAIAMMGNCDTVLKASSNSKRRKIDHRTLPRAGRRVFHHDDARSNIFRDYLGANPLLGKEFPLMFRITRTRFEDIMVKIQALEMKFYQPQLDRHGNETASFEARLLLPLKTYAYGVPPHCFMDYFQMSETLCDDCCKNFDKAMMAIYMKEYLRVPTKADLKAIAQLHKSVHQVDGMFGSLDCTHTYWKNCPKAWHGTYKGKEKKPSIVLEAICDYQLFFWHASYGYCGTLNDINILNLSPFLSQLVDGTFHDHG